MARVLYFVSITDDQQRQQELHVAFFGENIHEAWLSVDSPCRPFIDNLLSDRPSYRSMRTFNIDPDDLTSTMLEGVIKSTPLMRPTVHDILNHADAKLLNLLHCYTERAREAVVVCHLHDLPDDAKVIVCGSKYLGFVGYHMALCAMDKAWKNLLRTTSVAGKVTLRSVEPMDELHLTLDISPDAHFMPDLASLPEVEAEKLRALNRRLSTTLRLVLQPGALFALEFQGTDLVNVHPVG